MVKLLTKLLMVMMLGVPLIACSPEVGSKEWCEMMDEKPKGEWTGNEASEYTKNCVF